MNKIAEEFVLRNLDIIDTYSEKFHDTIDDSYGFISEILCSYAVKFISKYHAIRWTKAANARFRVLVIAYIYNQVKRNTEFIYVPVEYLCGYLVVFDINKEEAFNDLEGIENFWDLINILRNSRLIKPEYLWMLCNYYDGYNKRELSSITGMNYNTFIDVFSAHSTKIYRTIKVWDRNYFYDRNRYLYSKIIEAER